MKKEYRLSAGAILYTAILLRKAGIYGIQNVLEGMENPDFSGFAQKAERELMEKGYGILNFDGMFTLDDAFAAAVGHCADCHAVLGIGKRLSDRQEQLTGYLWDGRGSVLERAWTEEYLLFPNMDPVEEALRFLDLPKEQGNFIEACVDSMLVEQQDLEGLQDAGCSPDLAQLVVNAVQGIDVFAQISRTVQQMRTEELNLIYNKEGIVCITVEYSETEELFRLTPLTEQETVEKIREMARTGEEDRQ